MKPKLSLEDTMNQLKARLEESEYKHALVCEALEGFLDKGHLTTTREWQQLCRAGRKALNGVVDDEDVV